MRAFFSWLGWAAFCLGVGLFGSLATRSSIPTWYAALAKPSWTPPGGLFGPVWTLLYLMMGTAAWLVWRKEGPSGARLALGLFLAQLLFNGLWSWIFFGLHRPGLALLDLALLWAGILATIRAFRLVSPAAAWLMAPYLAWVSFAGLLNAAIWRLN